MVPALLLPFTACCLPILPILLYCTLLYCVPAFAQTETLLPLSFSPSHSHSLCLPRLFCSCLLYLLPPTSSTTSSSHLRHHRRRLLPRQPCPAQTCAALDCTAFTRPCRYTPVSILGAFKAAAWKEKHIHPQKPETRLYHLPLPSLDPSPCQERTSPSAETTRRSASLPRQSSPSRGPRYRTSSRTA